MTQPECYVGLNSKGTIVAAQVFESAFPERLAATLASWILEGLVIQPAKIEEVRANFMKGEKADSRKVRYHIQIIVAGKGEFEVEAEGDDELLEEYQDYERYGNEPDWFEETDEEKSEEIPSNQLPLF